MRVKKGIEEIKNLFDLKDKVGVVTGGSGGFGRAVSIGLAAYGASKGAVHLLTKQLALEWAKHKIRVNCIAPCIFWTPLTEPILSDPKMYELFMSRIPLDRAAEPEDFIGAVIYLASEASEMVTGHVLSVDGGAVAG